MLTFEALDSFLPLLPSHPVAEEEADHNSYRATRLEDKLSRQGPQRIGGSEDVKALWGGGGGGGGGAVVMLKPCAFMHVRHANFSKRMAVLKHVNSGIH